jgi:hypothetical protein
MWKTAPVVTTDICTGDNSSTDNSQECPVTAAAAQTIHNILQQRQPRQFTADKRPTVCNSARLQSVG